jgi:outer membrane protein OmpA-like peptidoglycan-associated protein
MDPAGRLIKFAAAAVLVMSAGLACAQGRGATAAQARSYILTAFMTQSAPAILSDRVRVGAELEQRLALPPGADSGKVYQALIALTDNKSLDVRRATPAELASYGARPGLRTDLPVYTLLADDMKFLVQYDLEANNVPFVGQLGLAPPRPATAAAPAPAPAPAPVIREVRHEPEPKKPAIVTLVWNTEQFDYKKSNLSPAIRAKLDSDVVPKLKDFSEVRYLNISGHTDNIGSASYNQRLSERRANAVRTYLVSNGADASKIEIYGFGKTVPAKSCPGEGKGKQRKDCLAPNRRVQIEVQGTLR